MPKIERPAVPAPKTCVACARPFAWRKKWARDWEQVKYCSDACRRRGPLEHVAETPRTIVDRAQPDASRDRRRTR